jgi:hypothetical protein
VNYLETAFLFYLLSVLFIVHDSGRCTFGSKASLDLLARSLRPRNYTELARRPHEWTRLANLTFKDSVESIRTVRSRGPFL